eukprot:CAMPEP_0174295934 /NCGR_PEP_ID=MMETSP0809-20121228/46294_1 /TAXON_ID=73025 ORGANISM="Eutreptiella gymnastica-like, Strain CCMP1594" /NCGR_SAMPLE_ID=MMETSP0809 /ASSEMBLY_ACC=CAM_ASM_000658 /LENGTH=79 /DNA_ID=CAMNT_0015398587 /DNA_START=28 /DNA_END=267 /DNA_ORIENTATION=+
MGQTQATPAAETPALPAASKKEPSCKICCACPETRQPRDDCIIRRGKENCLDLIEAHYQCLLTEGFTKEQVDKLRASTK